MKINIKEKEIKIYEANDKDYVLSYNISTQKPEYRKIIKVHDVEVKHKDQIEIIFDKSSYITSKWHPTMIKKHGVFEYVRADAIEIGDITVNEHNEIVKVIGINNEPNIDENYSDLTVDGNENYYCSNNKEEYHVVHNTRLGAICVYFETWHKDFTDFLDTKKNSGDEKRRAKELFISASCSDLFMKRVRNNEKWTMFDPFDTPELTETYGEEFEKIYLKYENDFESGKGKFTNTPVQVNAKEIWKKLQRYYWETGMPNLFFKDNVNRAHLNKDEGIIRSSNLCTEILQNTESGTENKEKKTILCNLGSINLAKVNTKQDFERIIPIAHRILDNIIDITTYPIPGTEKVQKRSRAVGLGICGEAELIANNQIMYGSEEHQNFIDNLYKNFSEVSDDACRSLANERGPWKEGEEFRNAYRRAIAPTSSIGILMGTTATHEASFDKVWIEENKMGNFKMIAPNLNPDNYQFYVNPYDVNQKDSVKCTAIRTKYIDQGISHNFYWRPGISGKEVFDTLFLAWELGMKTTYYLKSEGVKEDLEVKDNKVVCFGCAG